MRNAPSTFTAYAKARRITPDAIGDFVRDFVSDMDRTSRRFRAVRDLTEYLTTKHACAGALAAGIALWREWEGIAQSDKHSRNQGLSQ